MQSAAISTRHALKEWPSAIRALLGGRQVILLRKGGILEPHGEFRPRTGDFVLYPGHEHERAELLKAEEASRWRDPDSVFRAGAPVRIEAFARLDAAFEVRDPLRAFALTEHHIWNEQFVRQRVDYKPELPLHVLIARVWALPGPVEVPFRERYAGCRSWVELEEAVSLEGARPVLGEEEFARRASDVKLVLDGLEA